MISPVRIDLATLKPDSLSDWLAPLVPGLLLGVGITAFHPELASDYFLLHYLDYSVKVGVAFAAFYLLGLLVTFAWGSISFALGFSLAMVVHMKSKPWHNILWRKVAKLYLDEKIAPAIENLWDKDAAAEVLPDLKRGIAGYLEIEEVKVDPKKLEGILDQVFEFGNRSDDEWKQLYQVLAGRFGVNIGPEIKVAANMLGAVPSAGLSALILLWIAPFTTPIYLWALAAVLLILGIVLVASVVFAMTIRSNHCSAESLTTSMLQALDDRKSK